MPEFKLAPGAEWSSVSVFMESVADQAAHGQAALAAVAALASLVMIARLCDGLTTVPRRRR